jgi:hypothetical protein
MHALLQPCNAWNIEGGLPSRDFSQRGRVMLMTEYPAYLSGVATFERLSR